MVKSPFDLDKKLLELHHNGEKVRLVSSYSVKWKTKGFTIENINKLLAHEKDFYIDVNIDGRNLFWSRIWNYAPNEDYTLFIQAPSGCHMNTNPLNEVGCPYVVRGFDYDYLGVLWLDDLVWRGNKWSIQLNSVHETAIKNTCNKARRGDNKALQSVEEKIKLGYRILLTRALKGVYLFIRDDETRSYITSLIK